MSIFTEQSNLEAVLNTIKQLEFVDSNNIFLMGTSQGGLVSAMVATKRQEEIRGAILLYPAFNIPDDARETYESADNVPEKVNFMGMTIGKSYYQDLFDYDIYEVIKDYEKDVLILHGDLDSIVYISYSERATKIYVNNEYRVIRGAGHGFYGSKCDEASSYILDFIFRENIV